MESPGQVRRRFDSDLETRHDCTLLGLDEVGRGCLAGPVVAAAVALTSERDWTELDDSKRLGPLRRALYAEQLRLHARAVAWAFVGPREIERTVIRRASLTAMARAAMRARRRLAAGAAQGARVVFALVDGLDEVPGFSGPQLAVTGGDGKSLAVAAASIVAKVVRDGFMDRIARDYPRYGFDRNKGYGTAEHLDALDRHGPCAWHRRSFRPIAQLALAFD